MPWLCRLSSSHGKGSPGQGKIRNGGYSLMATLAIVITPRAKWKLGAATIMD
eukprot:CAMPEP_0194485334 /NCGR_PEP_ID=MMETSP0253-20130528/6380_1 /TAXON_ID=2966 /ORGANISM="Noctiluca scintillans" /LENGTH=51 /DNA_ID=CAMNT_0039325305 /DNA_START=49 /DNA_END=204 /DNA_ORIENTATION=+